MRTSVRLRTSLIPLLSPITITILLILNLAYYTPINDKQNITTINTEKDVVKPSTLRQNRHTIIIPLEPCNCSRTINTTALNPNSSFSFVNSNCGNWATARGINQKVVSYSIYGTFPGDYHRGLEKLSVLVEQFYPGWTMRVYHNNEVWLYPEQRQWACSLACEHSHLDFCDITQIPGLGNVNKTWGSLWRFIVMGDPTVDRYIIRDADSPILQREVDAVNEWIMSGKCYHVMRDNPNHAVKILAGMWGGCNTKCNESLEKPEVIRGKVLEYGKEVNQDQKALWLHVWPEVLKDGISHDSFSCMRFPGSLPFPTKREGNSYIGMRTYKEKYKLDGIRRTCPEICRPEDHKDWQDC